MPTTNLSSFISLIKISLSTAILFFLSVNVSARNSKEPSLIGDWIKVDIYYLNGSPLEEYNSLKYSFLKYSFKRGKKAAIITNFLSEGGYNLYEEKNGAIEIPTMYDTKIKLHIAHLTQDTLIVIQHGPLGPSDPTSLSITLVRYDHLQKISTWSNRDYALINSTDTVYKASKKIHPTISNPYGVRNSLQKNIKSYGKYFISPKENMSLFFATFIVRKSGKIDNIKIIQGIDPDFDKNFVVACKKIEKQWKPALYNNRPVDSEVIVDINFDFLSEFISDEKYIKSAMVQIEKGNIEKAILYFDKMLSLNPKNEKALIFRGQCYLELKEKEAACENFSILKQLGFESGQILLNKYCN